MQKIRQGSWKGRPAWRIHDDSSLRSSSQEAHAAAAVLLWQNSFEGLVPPLQVSGADRLALTQIERVMHDWPITYAQYCK